MSKSRKNIPQKVKALLQQEIHSACPICNDLNVDHFEIHHIDEEPENNAFENLLMLCPICHSKITKGDITKEETIQIKKFLAIKNKGTNGRSTRSSIRITGNVHSSTVANTISANTIIYKSKSKPKIEYAEGAIGRNAEMRNYIKHLMDRFNEYKEIEIGRGRMKYAAIWSTAKNEFKADAYQIPVHQFDALCKFLQHRIDNTKQGRINRGKGHKNYSLFEDIY